VKKKKTDDLLVLVS